MKFKNILGLFVCSAILFSCKDSKDYHDVVYMTGVEESTSRAFVVDVAPSEAAISVSASTKVEADVTVDLKISNDLIDAYNKRNKKDYKELPAGSYNISGTQAVIKAGTSTSAPLKVSITSFDDFEEAVTYLLPIQMVNIQGDIELLTASSTLYYVINRTLITQAAILKNNFFTVDFASQNDANLKSLSAVTYETKIYVDNFQARDPYISSVMGLEENFLLRFGDVTIKPNQLQIAKPGVTSGHMFETKKWYHIAAVFDNGEVRMYINGKLENTGNRGQGTLDLTKVEVDPSFMIGRSSNSRGIDGKISECRVWSRALSPQELSNNVCYVDPTTPGLVAYWRFNGPGEDPKIATDLTGHGYDAKARSNISWFDNVRCPE